MTTLERLLCDLLEEWVRDAQGRGLDFNNDENKIDMVDLMESDQHALSFNLSGDETAMKNKNLHSSQFNFAECFDKINANCIKLDLLIL